MRRWEYKIVELIADEVDASVRVDASKSKLGKREAWMNQLGFEGWRLVQWVGAVGYFEREIFLSPDDG